MAAPAFVLGLDVARTGLGLVVLAGDGTVLASLRRAYGGSPGDPLDPQDWWRAARTGIKEILRRASLRPEQIRSIGVTGDDAVVALGKDGRALCPAMLGPDPRCLPQVEQLTKTVGARTLLNLASGTATTTAAAVKLLHLRDSEKRVWHDLTHVLSAKDFIRHRLTDAFITDACDAASTLLFNPKTRSWSKQLLQLLDFNAEWLPAIANGQALSGRVTDSAAREAGLQAGTPVATGAGHAAALAIASGVVNPGAAVIELGGQGCLFAPTPEALRDPQGRLASTCHSLPGTWALSGSDLAGSNGLDWIMEQVLPAEVAQARRNQRDPIDLLAELAAEVAPGADGLMYLSASIRPGAGGFIGLESRHGRGHLVRAVLEGGALACRRALAALAELKRAPDQVLASGPGSSNHLWCQILADALDRPITSVPVPESAAFGAAVLAAVAVGMFKTVDEACARLVKAKATFQPRRAASDAYAALAPLAARIPDALAAPLAPKSAVEGQA
jgi:xylulokinase